MKYSKSSDILQKPKPNIESQRDPIVKNAPTITMKAMPRINSAQHLTQFTYSTGSSSKPKDSRTRIIPQKYLITEQSSTNYSSNNQNQNQYNTAINSIGAHRGTKVAQSLDYNPDRITIESDVKDSYVKDLVLNTDKDQSSALRSVYQNSVQQQYSHRSNQSLDLKLSGYTNGYQRYSNDP